MYIIKWINRYGKETSTEAMSFQDKEEIVKNLKSRKYKGISFENTKLKEEKEYAIV